MTKVIREVYNNKLVKGADKNMFDASLTMKQCNISEDIIAKVLSLPVVDRPATFPTVIYTEKTVGKNLLADTIKFLTNQRMMRRDADIM